MTIETVNTPLDDATFVAQFEDLTLDPAYFSHLGHLRLAWLYLKSYDVETAVERVCQGIKRYAESLGAHEKFNLTLTDAFTRIMAERMGEKADGGLEDFLKGNSDLVGDAFAVLTEYFSKELLLSKQARISLVAPDLNSLP